MPNEDGFDEDPAVASNGVDTFVAVWVNTYGNKSVWLSQSSDGGLTWTPPMVVSTEEETAAISDPHPTVSFLGSSLIVAWVQKGNFSGSGGDADVHCRVTRDMARTWLAEVILGAGMNDTYLNERRPAIAADSTNNRALVRSVLTDPL